MDISKLTSKQAIKALQDGKITYKEFQGLTKAEQQMLTEALAGKNVENIENLLEFKTRKDGTIKKVIFTNDDGTKTVQKYNNDGSVKKTRVKLSVKDKAKTLWNGAKKFGKQMVCNKDGKVSGWKIAGLVAGAAVLAFATPVAAVLGASAAVAGTIATACTVAGTVIAGALVVGGAASIIKGEIDYQKAPDKASAEAAYETMGEGVASIATAVLPKALSKLGKNLIKPFERLFKGKPKQDYSYAKPNNDVAYEYTEDGEIIGQYDPKAEFNKTPSKTTLRQKIVQNNKLAGFDEGANIPKSVKIKKTINKDGTYTIREQMPDGRIKLNHFDSKGNPTETKIIEYDSKTEYPVSQWAVDAKTGKELPELKVRYDENGDIHKIERYVEYGPISEHSKFYHDGKLTESSTTYRPDVKRTSDGIDLGNRDITRQVIQYDKEGRIIRNEVTGNNLNRHEENYTYNDNGFTRIIREYYDDSRYHGDRHCGTINYDNNGVEISRTGKFRKPDEEF